MGSRMSKSKKKSVGNSMAPSNIGMPPDQQPAKPHQAPNTSSTKSSGARNKTPAREAEEFDKHARRTPQDQRSSGVTVRNAGTEKTVMYRENPSGLTGRDHGPKESQIDRDERKRVHKKDDESGKIAQLSSRFVSQRGGFPQKEQTFEQSTVRNPVRVDDERRLSKNSEPSTQRRPFPDSPEVVERGKCCLHISPSLVKCSKYRDIQSCS